MFWFFGRPIPIFRGNNNDICSGSSKQPEYAFE